MMKKLLLLLISVFSITTMKAQYISLNDSCLTAQLKAKTPTCFNANNELDTTCTALKTVTELFLVDCYTQFEPSYISLSTQNFLKYYTELKRLNYSPLVDFNAVLDDQGNILSQLLWSASANINFSESGSKLKEVIIGSAILPELEYPDFTYQNAFVDGYILNVSSSVSYIGMNANSISVKKDLYNIKEIDLFKYQSYLTGGFDRPEASITQLNDSLEKFSISNYYAKNDDTFPKSLKELTITNLYDNSTLSDLSYLENLEYLTLINNPGNTTVVSLKVLPPKLVGLTIQDMQLSCIPILNDSLRYIDSESFSCIPNENKYIKAAPYRPLCTDFSKLCQLPPINPKGKVYFDANKNGKYDNGETFITGAAIQNSVFQNTYYSSSDSGKYAVNFQNGVSNIITATYNNPLVNSIVPAQYSFTPLENVLNPDTLNFGIQFKEDANDIATSVTSATPARPGFSTSAVAIVEERSGKSFNNITLKYIKPSDWTFNNAVPAVSSISGDTLIWNNISIAPLEKKPFDIQLTLPATAEIIGDSYQFVSNVSISATDSDISNNTASFSGVIRGAYDPNDKLVNATAILPQDIDKELTYTIRFQNTGTDTAFTVVIKDSLLGSLNPQSIRLLSASHSYTAELDENNVMTFTFDNILLPDSNVNEAASHGYVTFAITPDESLVLGDSILNTAAIYFDFNEPIITNTIRTDVKIISSIYNRNSNSLRIYPNPARENIRVEGQNIQNGILTITDVTGKVVFSQRLQNNFIDIPVQQLQKGMYIISTQNGDKLSVAKVIVQ